jgi:hypothetical protein
METRLGGNPIFEIIEPNRHIKIYANGVIEGCEGLAGNIVNHIGAAIRPEWFAYFSKSQDSEDVSVPHAKVNP